MRILFVAFTALVLGASAAAADPFSGAVERFFSLTPGGSAPATPAQFGGDGCEGLDRGARVWWGRFAGGRNSGPGNNTGTRRQTHTSQGCFPSANACQAWLNALATRYNARPIYNHCQPGYEPGAPVPPWWAPRA